MREFFLKHNVEEFEIKSSHRVIKNEKKRSKKQLVSTEWMAGERERTHAKSLKTSIRLDNPSRRRSENETLVLPFHDRGLEGGHDSLKKYTTVSVKTTAPEQDAPRQTRSSSPFASALSTPHT